MAMQGLALKSESTTNSDNAAQKRSSKVKIRLNHLGESPNNHKNY